MKIRDSFVSNSSSSSFLIRGIRIKKDELAKIFDVETWEDIPYQKQKHLALRDTRDYFDGKETDDCIIGIDLGGLDDGVVKEIPDTNDISVRAALIHAGIPIEKLENLSTFVQYISNDNY